MRVPILTYMRWLDNEEVSKEKKRNDWNEDFCSSSDVTVSDSEVIIMKVLYINLI